jgi:hypothetical protein
VRHPAWGRSGRCKRNGRPASAIGATGPTKAHETVPAHQLPISACLCLSQTGQVHRGLPKAAKSCQTDCPRAESVMGVMGAMLCPSVQRTAGSIQTFYPCNYGKKVQKLCPTLSSLPTGNQTPTRSLLAHATTLCSLGTAILHPNTHHGKGGGDTAVSSLLLHGTRRFTLQFSIAAVVASVVP